MPGILKIVFFSLIAAVAFSQQDSVYFDRDVIIEDQGIRKLRGNSRANTWESSSLSEPEKSDLTELLWNRESVYVRSYGPGILSTSTFRGGQAAHTLVLWNGLPVQSPLVGQLDLSLISLQGMDACSIAKGGQSSAWGSGAIGGIISLDNIHRDTVNTAFNIATSAGSFGMRGVSAGLSMTGKKISSTSRYAYKKADNDFNYRVGNDVRTIENAGIKRHTINQDIYLRAGDRTELSLHYWGVFANRQIPPTINQSTSDAKQTDDIHRIAFKFRQVSQNGILKGNFGYFNERLVFEEKRLSQYSDTGFESLVADISYEWTVHPSVRLFTGMNHISNFVRASQNYTKGTSETRTGIFAGMRYSHAIFSADIQYRQEIFEGNIQAAVPSLRLEYTPFESNRIYGKVSRNFRYPSINDRYWIPGGNTELEAESGWSGETGMRQLFQVGDAAIEVSLDAFTRRVSNWIQWAPDDRTGFWSAFNLTEVWSRGLEFGSSYSLKINEWGFKAHTKYDYIRSSSLETIKIPRIEKGQQLWYTPEHTLMFDIDILRRNWGFRYMHRWNSKTRGLNTDVDPWQSADAEFFMVFNSNQNRLKAWLTLNNIWNEDYTIIEYRPMPGRFFEAGIRLELKK